MALYLENSGKVFFRNGLPSSIFWSPQVLTQHHTTVEDLQVQANEELRVCGFHVKVGEVKFEKENDVLFARVWWR